MPIRGRTHDPSSHSVRFILPGGWGAARRWLAPARGAPSLLRPRPSNAARVGAPRCPQETASPTPHPGSARWGSRGLRRHGRPTRQAEVFHPPDKPACTPQAAPSKREGGGEIAPRAAGAISPQRAGPQRGTSLLGGTRRRVGGLGSKPSPSDRSRPVGQKERPSRSGRRKQGRPPAGQNKRPTQ
jgi:hypothetical protein